MGACCSSKIYEKVHFPHCTILSLREKWGYQLAREGKYFRIRFGEVLGENGYKISFLTRTADIVSNMESKIVILKY